jgi:hypothetical protein
MPTVKRIVCLANSRKMRGSCIAGREWTGKGPGPWIRPVSGRPHRAVSAEEQRYEDGTYPQVMDIIDIPIVAACPEGYQQENCLLDPNYYWKKCGRADWQDLAAMADPPDVLWTEGFSTYHGRHDRVPVNQAVTLTSSLRLIRTDHLTLSVFAPGAAFGDPSRKLYGRFHHAGTEYRLRITDPLYENAYLMRPDGEYHLQECYLTISLGEPWDDGFAYKLIAAIIEKPGGIGA